MTSSPTPPDAATAGDVRLPVASTARTWAVLGGEVRALGGRTAVALLVVLAASAVGLVPPWVLGWLVDDVAAGAPVGQVVRAAVVIGAAAVLGGALTGLSAWLVARVGETVLARVRERVLDRALRLPWTTLERSRVGDLLARVGDDVSVVATVITTTGPEMVAALFVVVLTGAGLFALDWRLGVAGLLALPAYVLAVRWYLPRSGPLYARERVAVGERSHALVDALQGAATIRAYRLERQHHDRVRRRSAAAVDLAVGVISLYTRFVARMNRAEFVGLTAVLATGFFLVRSGQATVGAATAAALYFHRLFNPIGVLVLQFDEIQAAGASLARLVGVADLPDPVPDAPRATRAAAASLDLTGVSHRYGRGPLVLRDVTLRIAAGERVALVGASGAGKTTLAGIAAGVLRPTSGSVHLGGAPPRPHDPAGTPGRVVLVSQEVHVFSGPLVEDVRLARAGATDGEVLAALDAVGALAWVRALPDGPHTHVGEGGRWLTPTQAQQLALARLVLADPGVAILDEATAEAGSAGARELERAAAAATQGRTTLIVAHRLTQAALADRIVVLADGQVVETGPHEELVRAGGPYSALWRSWLGRPR